MIQLRNGSHVSEVCLALKKFIGMDKIDLATKVIVLWYEVLVVCTEIYIMICLKHEIPKVIDMIFLWNVIYFLP